MALNYKSLDSDGEDFELLCRDVLESIGAKIVSEPTRGPDQKKDLVIEVNTEDPLGNKSCIKYLVQCKHKAHSGKSVYEAEIGDFRSACLVHDTDGYFLITTTIASTTVATQLNAENDRGSLKTVIWDGKKLEEKIESSPKSAQIISTYNLKESIEVTFGELKRILMGEYHLPFDFDNEVLDSDLKGLIYKEEALDQQYETKVFYRGYFCTTNLVNEEYITDLKNRYNLASCEFFTSEPTSDTATSLDDLYRRLQNYRDTYYQECLWKVLHFSPMNPSSIRMIEQCIRNMPYEPQEVTIGYLKRLIEEQVHNIDIFLIMEACQAAANLKVLDAKQSILDQLRVADSWNLSEEHTAAFAQSLVGALCNLEQDEQNCTNQVFQVFGSLQNKQVLAEIVGYFTKLSVKDVDGQIKGFFDSNSGVTLPPTNHGVMYNSRQIHLLRQAVPIKVDDLKKRYYEALTSNT